MTIINNKKGFTLIELLVAISIVSIIALAFFRIANSSILSNSKNEKDIKAMQIAQTQIENIRSQLKKDDTLKTLTLKYSIDSQGTINEKNIQLEEKEDKIEESFEHKTSDNSTYRIQIILTREKGSANKYLYAIKAEVNTNLSKKKTILNTSILDT
ncbi:MAG: type IV pilus modification PilV family protein [Peptostreptococcaceae bacterium]